MLTNFAQVLAAVRGLPPRKVAVAAAQDDAVLQAAAEARAQGIADFILVGDEGRLERAAAAAGVDLTGFTVVTEPDDRQAAYRAAALVSGGQADVLMKGMISTADLLRAVLDKDVGLRTGRVLSHASVFQVPGFARLLIVTDGGMNIAPDIQHKADIVQNAVTLAASLGISPVRVAVLAAVEVVNPDMPATLAAAALAKMAERGQIKGAVIDGPLALDNAINAAAAQHKGIKSPVAGQADILLVPDIEAGNILGKALVYFSGATMAGLVLGARRPVVVTSRADSPESKVMSLACAALLCTQDEVC